MFGLAPEWAWPFMLFGLLFIIWNHASVWWGDRRDTHNTRMDSAEKTHRDEFFEENPWDAN